MLTSTKIIRVMLPGGIKRDYPEPVPTHLLLSWMMKYEVSSVCWALWQMWEQEQKLFLQIYTNVLLFMHPIPNPKVFPPLSICTQIQSAVCWQQDLSNKCSDSREHHLSSELARCMRDTNSIKLHSNPSEAGRWGLIKELISTEKPS